MWCNRGINRVSQREAKGMLEIFKTQDDKTLKTLNINDAKSGSWFNMIDPSFEEIQKVSHLFWIWMKAF